MDLLRIKDTEGQEVLLDEKKVYYLAHPLTTGGLEDVLENRQQEELYFLYLKQAYPNLRVIRPLEIVPTHHSHDEAMALCFHLMGPCDTILLPKGWKTSDGCCKEKDNAEKTGMEILRMRFRY